MYMFIFHSNDDYTNLELFDFGSGEDSFDENSGDVVIGWPLRSPIPFVPMIIWVHPIVISCVPIKPVSASKTVGEKTTLSFSAKEPGFEELFKNPKNQQHKISLNDQITV